MLVTSPCPSLPMTALEAGGSDPVDGWLELIDIADVSEAFEGIDIATEWVTTKD